MVFFFYFSIPIKEESSSAASSDDEEEEDECELQISRNIDLSYSSNAELYLDEIGFQVRILLKDADVSDDDPPSVPDCKKIPFPEHIDQGIVSMADQVKRKEPHQEMLDIVENYLQKDVLNREYLAKTLQKYPTDWKYLLLSGFFWRGYHDSQLGSKMVSSTYSRFTIFDIYLI